MTDSVHVEVARAGERDQLLAALRERGLDAVAHDEDDRLVIEVPCGDDADRGCADVMTEIETWLAESEAPLVPQLAERSIFLRPPLS